MKSIEDSENKISDQRMKYNEAVSMLNKKLKSFFGIIVKTITKTPIFNYYEPPLDMKEEIELNFDKKDEIKQISSKKKVSNTNNFQIKKTKRLNSKKYQPVSNKKYTNIVKEQHKEFYPLNKLIVKAVIESSSKSRNTAIIEYTKDKYDSFKIGEKLPGYNAYVTEINTEFILIRNNSKKIKLLVN